MIQRKVIFKVLSILPILIFNFSVFAQTPCLGGMAGVFPCNGIDLQARILKDTFSASAGNDIWGWTSPSGKEYAIIGLNNGTAFVDVTVATTPTYIGKLPKPAGASNSTWQDMKVMNNHAYIGTESNGHHIQVFDLMKLTTTTSGLPVAFTADGSVNIGDGSSHNIVANEDVGYICGVGANQAGGGLVFYDLSNPKSPTPDGQFSAAGYSHDALCVIYRGPDTEYIGREICIGFNANDVDIVDVTDRPNYNWISNTNYTPLGYTHQGWLTDDHRYLIFGDELDEKNGHVSSRKTLIFDLLDLNSPVELAAHFGNSNSIDHNQYVKGSYLYQANYTEGLQILDISDINNIQEVASFDIVPNHNNTTFTGAWSVYPYFKSGNILVNGIGQGFFVVNPNLPHYIMEHSSASVQTVCAGSNASYSIDLTEYDSYGSNVILNLSGIPSGAVSTLGPAPVSPNGSVSFNITNTNLATAGKYQLLLTGDGSPAQKLSLGLVIIDEPDAVNLLSPMNGSMNTGIPLIFEWSESPGAEYYNFEVGTDDELMNVVLSAQNLTDLSYEIEEGLEPNTQFYWRVQSVNICDDTYSAVHSFQTGSGALPVEIFTFEARPLENSIFINWSTAAEIQNTGFELQRFAENQPNNFEKIAWIPAKGNAPTITHYNFEDVNVESNTTYFYRLKQIDVDGTVSFSNIVSAKIENIEQQISIFPNPVEDILTIELDDDFTAYSNFLFTISDVNGRELQQQNINTNQFKLDVSDLESGVYMIQFEVEGQQIIRRFMKM